MIIHNFKKLDKGTLIGKLDIEFENWGLTIRECLLMKGSTGMWLAMPSRMYEKDGEKKYYHLVVFNKDKKQQLTDEVLEKLKDELSGQPNMF